MKKCKDISFGNKRTLIFHISKTTDKDETVLVGGAEATSSTGPKELSLLTPEKGKLDGSDNSPSGFTYIKGGK